jgi:hypothetical protein
MILILMLLLREEEIRREPPVHRRSGWCLHLRDCIDLCAEIMEEELQGG